MSEDRRHELELRLAELSATWRATNDADTKAGIKAEMDRLRVAVNDINRLAARRLREKIDEILRNLEEVRTRHGLNAASALGRSIDRLRESRNRL